MKAIGWLDLTVEDARSVRDFYARVLGWRPEPVEMGEYADYVMIDPISGEPAGGVCHARGTNVGLPPVWMVYFRVPDLDGALREAADVGGTVVREPRSGGGVRFAVVRDPGGAVCALFEPEAAAEQAPTEADG